MPNKYLVKSASILSAALGGLAIGGVVGVSAYRDLKRKEEMEKAKVLSEQEAKEAK